MNTELYRCFEWAKMEKRFLKNLCVSLEDEQHNNRQEDTLTVAGMGKKSIFSIFYR